MGSLKSSRIAIINADVFNHNIFCKGAVLIKNKKIFKVIKGEISKNKIKNYRIIDAEDSYVSYGFIDPHVHFRCPGHEYKEDWDSGSKAAVKGGYTFIIDMPNNNPPAVDFETLTYKNKIAKNALINYGFYIGLTLNNSKKIKELYKRLKLKNIPVFGVKVFLGSSTGDLLITDDVPIYDSLNTSLLNLFHCEDQLILNKYKNIKYNSIFDHDKIRPSIAEVNGIKKIIKNAKNIKSKAKIYICHVSSKEEMKIIEKYKKENYNIITEITPHHLFFDLSNISKSNIFKVNPPIRGKKDVEEARKKFNEGFFQIIGTDHAPHLKKEKESKDPPSGFPGLETSFYSMYSLYENGIIKLENIFKLLTSGYKIFNIRKRGELKKGNFADVIIIKKEKNIFKTKDAYTKADFSPFDGLKTGCRINTVIINGKIILENGEFL